MLMHPYLDVPYNPQLKHFLGGFDIYDREETLGSELAEYDPECPSDRVGLISKFVVKRFSGLTYRHKFVLFSVLGEALDGEISDLAKVFKHDPFSHSLLPFGWNEMKDPKIFFEHIYSILSEVWTDDLYLAGQEDCSTW
ncbi:hypothetical protein [Pseudomonas sp. RU47]|jgi:hypothetical protein|uniref:hypothetical protein n=1 Tax=Pseudomonas sp. RU47 TaxID=2005388 RepID=UPI000FDD0746|nr:hypothetical protein [Pseudomonas sp. RU47]AZZ75210.1 hypothetical protein CCX46_08630 [Pseudomonas sp. RU47]